MSTRTAPVQVGDVLADKYRVEHVLGVGGMGAVVAVTHLHLNERRAIKLMLPEVATEAEATERFMREARASARLKNEHVVEIHDVGRLSSGEPYIVMEHLEGRDLEQMVDADGPLPLGRAVDFLLQALEAIAEAHSAGIVHRDLKPSNLFVTTDADGLPTVKVLDFGISKLSDQPGEMRMTSTEAVFGSPKFMSPEQLMSARNADERSDIWSLGVVLYILATGVIPFRGGTITALCMEIVGAQPQPLSHLVPQIPATFEAVVARCLAKNREQRYQSCAELAAALAPFAHTNPELSLRRIGRVLGVELPWSASEAAPAGPAPQPQAQAATAPMPVVSPDDIPLDATVAMDFESPGAAAAPAAHAGGGLGTPPAPARPRAAAASGHTQLAGANTAASWGRTAPPTAQPAGSKSARTPLIVLGGLLAAAAAVAIVVAGLSSSDTAASGTPATSDTSEPADAATVATSGASPTASASDAASTASPTATASAAASDADAGVDAGPPSASAPSAQPSTADARPRRPPPKPPPKPPPTKDPWGKGRK